MRSFPLFLIIVSLVFACGSSNQAISENDGNKDNNSPREGQLTEHNGGGDDDDSGGDADANGDAEAQNGDDDAAGGVGVEVVHSYAGRISRVGSEYAGHAIRDQEAYEAFIERIPEHEITRMRNPPRSDDPLLEKPEVDWDTNMMLAVHRYENMYVTLYITEITRTEEGDYNVRVELAPIGNTDMMASALGIGIYHAVIVPRTDGEVTFEFVEQESDDDDDSEE